MSRILPAVGAIGVAALVLAGCSGAADSSGEAGPKILTLGVTGVETFDPAGMVAAGEGLTIWQGVYDTLVGLDAEGEFEPALATEWSYDESLTTLTLNLREGVEFSDGAPFNADAVVANYEHFVGEPAANITMAASVSDVVAVDESTVEFVLSQPDPGLEFSLAGPLGAMVSPEALASEDLTTNPVGTGPYVADASRTAPGSQFVFTRRDGDHWNADAWAWDEIVFKVIADQSARLNALRSGEIDGSLVNAQSYDEVQSAGFEILSNPVDTTGLGLFDRDGAVQPALADVRVRQAIGYAFDREEMLESIQLGHGQLPGALFPGIEPIDGIEFDYDPEKAKDLLEEAGYANGFSMTGVDLGTGSPLYAIISDRLAAIGITMTWNPIAPSEALTEMFGGKYPAFNAVWSGKGLGGNPWFFVNSHVMSESPWNVFKTEDPELTALLDEARSTTGADRDEAYGKIDGWLSTNAWFIPFYEIDYLYALSPDVTATNALGNATPFLWSFQPAD